MTMCSTQPYAYDGRCVAQFENHSLTDALGGETNERL